MVAADLLVLVQFASGRTVVVFLVDDHRPANRKTVKMIMKDWIFFCEPSLFYLVSSSTC